MKSIYFLPYTGVEKFDEINDQSKIKLSSITTVVTILSEKVKEFYPERAKFDIPELIFIPTVFDYRNAASYQGIEFALRWYFHITSSDQRTNFKIVLIGSEDKASFFQNCDYSNFLKCPNVEYLQNSFEAINNYIENYNIKEIEKKEVLEKIKLIGIKAPTSYKSHHSIANEWAILRWAKVLNIQTSDQNELKKIEDNIESDLYYKYLNTIHPIAQNDKFINKILLNSGNILFIDDEVEKGWDIIFKTICKNKTYSSFGKDFKNWNQMEIIEESFKKAKDADIVILDLRLHDLDFDTTSPKNLTGFQILEQIKAHNKGIQVIIFSATNKIWNLQALEKAGADGFILKESPENSVDANFTIQSIDNIYKTIDERLEMSFLKNVFSETRLLCNMNLVIKKEEDFKFKELKMDIKSKVTVALYLCQSKQNFDYALFNYIQILESYCNYFTVFDKSNQKAVVYKNQKDKAERSNEHTIYEIRENDLDSTTTAIHSKYKYEKGYYEFQKTNSYKDEQYINYVIEDIQYQDNSKFFSLSLKLVAILNLHISDISKIKKLMELIYIRNNKLAHSGNFDPKKRFVQKSDIEFIFNTLITLIRKSF